MSTLPILRNVFSTIQINGLELANRIVMSSLHLNWEGDDQFQRLARFYALRAKDGPGLIVTAGCSPDEAGRGGARGFSIHSDELIPSHGEIVRAVRAAGGSRIALQLLHVGREALHGELVAPSAIRVRGSLFTPHELSHDEIAETIRSYSAAARRAIEAGYDAIELVLSQGFLIHQFLASHSNLRQDEWGGTFERRLLLAASVSEAVRAAVGPRFPLIFRVPCLDLLPGGLSFEESMALIERLQRSQIDLLNIGIGWHEAAVPTVASTVPQAGFSSVAARAKMRFPHLLVCASNRVNDLRHAEELLIEGLADVVAMGRPFLADHQIVRKAKRGKFDAVCKCIACNEDCLDPVLQGKEAGCSVNPMCGTPTEGLARPRFRGTPSIAVVGGGLSGLACAAILGARGARVRIFEKSPHLGGQLLLAAKIPGKAEYLDVVRYFEREVRRAGGEVSLSRNFERDDIESGEWDHVVLATGTKPNEWRNAGGSTVRVIGYRELLANDLPVEYPVMIIGGGGVALDVGKYLLARQSRLSASEDYLAGHQVFELTGPLPAVQEKKRRITIVQRSTRKIGYKLGRTARSVALSTLERQGVEFVRGASVHGCADGEIELRMVRGERRTVQARTIVVAAGQHPEALELQKALDRARVPYSLVGAARASLARPASISSSVRSAYETAMNLTIPSLRAPEQP